MNIIYTRNAVYALLLALFTVSLYKAIKIVVLKRKGKKINCFQELISGFFVVYLAVILTLTLCPAPINWERAINIVPFRDVYYTAWSQGFTGAAMYTVKISFFNIIFLIPFGFLGVMLCYFKQYRKYTIVLGYGIVMVLFIEMLQYIFNTGRTADIDDVILNTLGVVIGILLGKYLVRRCGGAV